MLVVFAYLVVNIVGRLSVAVFGLSYNLKENITELIIVTNFGSQEWIQVGENASIHNMSKSNPTINYP
mgnify:CR=1 FL=1